MSTSNISCGKHVSILLAKLLPDESLEAIFLLQHFKLVQITC